jgi:hypothetical protein
MFQDAATGASIATDSEGDAVAAWSGREWTVDVAVRPAGLRSWRAPVLIPVSHEYPGIEGVPRVEIGNDGQAVVIWGRSEEWESRDIDRHVIEAAVGSAKTGRWGAPTKLSAPGVAADDPSVAVDASGDAIAVWELAENSKEDREGKMIQAAERPAKHQQWSAPTNVFSGPRASETPRSASTQEGVRSWCGSTSKAATWRS